MSVDTDPPHLSAPVPGLQRLTHAQFSGVIALLIGFSQMIVGTVALDGLLTVTVAWGGGLLFAFGYNLIQNRPVFYSGWTEDGEPGWVSLLISVVLTAAVLVAAGLVLLG